MKTYKILIAGKDESDVHSLEKVLGDYELILALDGNQVVTLVKESIPDLILMDLHLPLMDGYEACSLIKSNAKTRDVPIIFMIERSNAFDGARCLNVGAVDCITKPFSPVVAKARIDAYLELQKNRKILEKMAHLDAETNIPNRDYFLKVIDLEWRRATREQWPISLIFLEIDNFEDFRTKNGPLSSQQACRMVADELVFSARRSSDFVARYAEHQFVIVLPHMEVTACIGLAEKIRHKLETLRVHVVDGPARRLTVSIGVAADSPMRELPYKTLVEKAVLALENARKAGGNCVTFEE